MKTIEEFTRRLLLTEEQFVRAGALVRQLVNKGIFHPFNSPVDEPQQSLFESDWGYIARQHTHQLMMAKRMSTDYLITFCVAQLLAEATNAQPESSSENVDLFISQLLAMTKPLIEKTYPGLSTDRYHSAIFAAEFNRLLIYHTQTIGLGWTISNRSFLPDELESADNDHCINILPTNDFTDGINPWPEHTRDVDHVSDQVSNTLFENNSALTSEPARAWEELSALYDTIREETKAKNMPENQGAKRVKSVTATPLIKAASTKNPTI